MEALKADDPRVLGGFTLLCRLGSGGMGQVYLGESAAGQRVAVKVIKASALDEDGRARFALEVDSLKTVYGPFVASFVAADAHAERPWLAVEFVPAPDLAAFVAEQEPLPLVECASLGALMAEGLTLVHDAGLLHRDLKPQNVLLAPYGPKLIDFGLAVLAERRSVLTATGVVVGSVRYMPPEQARGDHQLTPAADVYALGAVLLYAATGHPPYDGPTWQAIALRIEDPDTPPDLSGLPPELAPLISEILVAEPAERPTLERITGQLVAIMADAGVTASQAKQRLTDRVRPAVLPEAPAVPMDPPPDLWAGYTPAVVDVAVAEEDDEASPLPRPDTGRDEDEPAVPPGPQEPATPRSQGTPRPGAPFTVPARIAERLRTAYARDARF
ncbi:protein kinase [Streptomyces sp. NPDC049881]|uniref:serine/threonine-protein kinase n=1 Tax=Streptomyces sp. NPDC049881 TaxID=3155778 RepID=UPI0034255EDA